MLSLTLYPIWHDSPDSDKTRKPGTSQWTSPVISPRDNGSHGSDTGQDLDKGRAAFAQWRDAAENMLDGAGTQASTAAFRLALKPSLPRPVWAMAVRYSLHLLERKAPGPGVEVRVAPWGAIKILDGPASRPA